MSQPTFHEWKILYAAAMLESDAMQIPQRIEKANGAIHARLHELAEAFPGGRERAELDSAVMYLNRLLGTLYPH